MNDLDAHQTHLSLQARRLIKYADPQAAKWTKEEHKRASRAAAGEMSNLSECGITPADLAKVLFVIPQLVSLGGHRAIVALLAEQQRSADDDVEDENQDNGHDPKYAHIHQSTRDKLAAAVCASFPTTTSSYSSLLNIVNRLIGSSSRGTDKNVAPLVFSQSALARVANGFDLGAPIDLLVSIAERFAMHGSAICSLTAPECSSVEMVQVAFEDVLLLPEKDKKKLFRKTTGNVTKMLLGKKGDVGGNTSMMESRSDRHQPVNNDPVLSGSTSQEPGGALCFHPLCKTLSGCSFLWMTPAVAACEQLKIANLELHRMHEHNLRDYGSLGVEWHHANRAAALEVATLGAEKAARSVFEFLKHHSDWLGAAAVHLHDDQASAIQHSHQQDQLHDFGGAHPKTTNQSTASTSGAVTPFVLSAFGSIMAYVAPATHHFDSTDGGDTAKLNVPSITAACTPFMHTSLISESLLVKQGGHSISLARFQEWTRRAGLTGSSGQSSSTAASGGASTSTHSQRGGGGSGVDDGSRGETEGINGSRTETSLWEAEDATSTVMSSLTQKDAALLGKRDGLAGLTEQFQERSDALHISAYPLVPPTPQDPYDGNEPSMAMHNAPPSTAAQHHLQASSLYLAGREQPFTVYRLLVLKHVWKLTMQSLVTAGGSSGDKSSSAAILVCARMVSAAAVAYQRDTGNLPPPGFAHQQLVFLASKETNIGSKDLAKTLDTTSSSSMYVDAFPTFAKILHSGLAPDLMSFRQWERNRQASTGAVGLAVSPISLYDAIRVFGKARLDANIRSAKRLATKRLVRHRLNHFGQCENNGDIEAAMPLWMAHGQTCPHCSDKPAGTLYESLGCTSAMITPAAYTLLLNNFVRAVEAQVAFAHLRSAEIINRTYKRNLSNGVVTLQSVEQQPAVATLVSELPQFVLQFPNTKWSATAAPPQQQHTTGADAMASPFNTKVVVTEDQIYVSPAVAALLREVQTLAETVSKQFQPRVEAVLAAGPVFYDHRGGTHPQNQQETSTAMGIGVNITIPDDKEAMAAADEREYHDARTAELLSLHNQIRTMTKRCRAMHKTFTKKSVLLPAALSKQGANTVTSSGGSGSSSPKIVAAPSVPPLEVATNELLENGAGSGRHGGITLESVERRAELLRQRKSLLDEIEQFEQDAKAIEQDGQDALSIRNDMVEELEKMKLDNKRHLKELHSTMQTQLDDLARQYGSRLALLKAKEAKRQQVLEQSVATFAKERTQVNVQWDEKEFALPKEVKRVEQLLAKVRQDAVLNKMSPIGRWGGTAPGGLGSKNTNDARKSNIPLYGRTFTPLAVVDIIGAGESPSNDPTAAEQQREDEEHRSVSMAGSTTNTIYPTSMSRNEATPRIAFTSGATSVRCMSIPDFCALANTPTATLPFASGNGAVNDPVMLDADSSISMGTMTPPPLDATSRRRRSTPPPPTQTNAIAEVQDELLHLGALHGWRIPFDYEATTTTHERQRGSLTVRCALRKDW